MSSPFVRFAVIFIGCVVVVFAVILWFRSLQPGRKQFVPPPSSSGARASSSPGAPQPMDEPPDLVGLNYKEVAIPGWTELPTPLPPHPNDYVSEISARKIAAPIDGLQKKDLVDSFADRRGGGGKHDAIDIMEPRETPVHAVVQGNIVKLFTSQKGGLTIYQFDDAQKYCFYYAHLDKYAEGIREGMLVRPGQLIGYVGSTGDAAAAGPHLHFAISLLDSDKKFWKGTPLNPYPVLVNAVLSNQ